MTSEGSPATILAVREPAPTSPTSEQGRISVLHVVGQLGIGGCETQLLALCRNLDRSRFSLSLCWYWRNSPQLDQEFAQAGVRTRFIDKDSMSPWTFFSQLRNAVREVRPDIVHTWLHSASFWGRWAAASCGVRGIVTSERSVVGSVPWRSRLTERLLAGRTVRVDNSEAVARSIERRLRFPASEVEIVPNAVELEPHDRDGARTAVWQELGCERDRPIILMVGRLHAHKNWFMLIEAGELVARERPDVMVVGIGVGPLARDIDERVARSPARESFRFVGLRRDVGRWLAAADLFCFTTNHEGFPNVLLEAMAAGVPIITTDFDGVREVVGDGEVAVVTPRRNAEAMAAQILQLLGNADRRREMSAAGRRRAEEEFSVPMLTSRMETIYSRLHGTAVR